MKKRLYKLFGISSKEDLLMGLMIVLFVIIAITLSYKAAQMQSYQQQSESVTSFNDSLCDTIEWEFENTNEVRLRGNFIFSGEHTDTIIIEDGYLEQIGKGKYVIRGIE